jgi:hypothetical protein
MIRIVTSAVGLLLVITLPLVALAQSRPLPTDAAERPVRDAVGQPLEYDTLAGGSSALGLPGRQAGLPGSAISQKANAAPAALSLAGEAPSYAELWRTASLGSGIGDTGIWPADVDNDGDEDLVLSGDNRFWSIVSFNATSGAYDIAWQSSAYDPEWISALALVEDQSTRRVWVGLSNGDIDVFDAGTREQVDTLAAGTAIEDIATGDADNDGSNNVVVLTRDTIRVYDPLTLGLIRSYPHTGRKLAVGNVDADDRIEVVVNTGLVLELSGADVTFDWVTDEFGTHVALGDIDADGKDELVGAGDWSAISAWDLDTKSVKWSMTPDHDVAAMRLFDVTGDGTPEVLYGDGQWGSIYAIDAVTRAELWSMPNPEHGVTDIAVVDSDDDDELEFLWGAGHTSSGPNYLYVHDVATGALEWQSDNEYGPYHATDTGDVDADGTLEFVVASSSSDRGYGVVMVFDAETQALEWQSGADTFGGYAWTIVHDLVLANVDDDAQLEIVLGTDRLSDGALYVIDGQTHALQHEVSYDRVSPLHVLDTVDLTGDGRPEVVAGNIVAHTGALGVFVYVLDPLADAVIWQSAAVSTGFGEISDVKAVDVGGPGIDLLAASGRLTAIRWSDKRQLATIDRGYRSVAASDVDGSQEQEILAGRQDGSVQVLDGETLAVTATYTVCTSPVVAIEVMPASRILVGCGSNLVVYDLGEGALVSTTESTVADVGRNGSLDTGVVTGRAVVLAGGSEAVAFVDVSDNHVPVMSASSASVHWRGEIDVTVTASDEDGDELHFELASLPSLGSAMWQNLAAGQLRYTSNGASTGLDSMAVRASDGFQYSAPAMLEITLTNTPPAAATADIELHWRGEQTAAVTATDTDGDPLSYAMVAAPAHGTVTMDAATGAITYTPVGAYLGEDSFTYIVSDGADASEDVVAVTLTNTAPVASGGDYPISPGTSVISQFPAEDADADPLTYSLVSGPVQGQLTFEADTGLFEYEPAAGATGTVSVTYSVSDGIADSEATVRFLYPAPPPPPSSGGGGGGSAGLLLPLLLAAMACARRRRQINHA